MSKHFYFKLFSLVNKVKWFQELLCITNNSLKHKSFIQTQLNDQTVLFQAIQLSINTYFSTNWPIDRTLSGATTPGQSGHGSEGHKWILRIPQSLTLHYWSLTVRLFSVISRTLFGGVLLLCSEAVGVFFSPSRPSHVCK